MPAGIKSSVSNLVNAFAVWVAQPAARMPSRRRSLAVFFIFGHGELREEVLEFLLVAGADHQDVLGVDDDEILHAAQGQELVVPRGVDDVVGAVLEQAAAGAYLL